MLVWHCTCSSSMHLHFHWVNTLLFSRRCCIRMKKCDFCRSSMTYVNYYKSCCYSTSPIVCPVPALNPEKWCHVQEWKVVERFNLVHYVLYDTCKLRCRSCKIQTQNGLKVQKEKLWNVEIWWKCGHCNFEFKRSYVKVTKPRLADTHREWVSVYGIACTCTEVWDAMVVGGENIVKFIGVFDSTA